MRKKKGFIAWGGASGLPVAKGLRELLRYPPQVELVLSADIEVGKDWYRDVLKTLEEVDFGIGCLTPGTLARPLFNFEAGNIYGRLENFKLVRLGVGKPAAGKLAAHLDRMQSVDGEDKEGLVKLLADILDNNETDARRWIEAMFPQWQRVVEEQREQIEYEAEIEGALDTLLEALRDLQKAERVRANACLRRVVGKSIAETTHSLRGARQASYTVPASEYPYYLVDLQRELGATVRAVALVDQQEAFWRQDIGREIFNECKRKKEENRRVFVFLDETDFDNNRALVQQHANQYQVRVLGQPKLFAEFPLYAKDFAVIAAEGGSEVLAVYDREEIKKMIRFSTDRAEVQRHEEAYEQIWDAAQDVPKNCSIEDFDQIRQAIFTDFTPYARKPVEMSAYLSVKDYDRYEEKHPYYVEMMARMIAIFEQHRRSRRWRAGEQCKVLEFGAGTGIFTKRLAELAGIDLVAVEIDWECFKQLLYNLQTRCPHIEFLNEDSRTHNPRGPGRFDYIFSSFADHHIKSKDKPGYFRNVINNLEPGGLFIVGDELLRPYRADDPQGWEEALEAYHRHVIDQARAEKAEILARAAAAGDGAGEAMREEAAGYDVLVCLEQEAYESGMRRQGDFKVSCEEYEKLLGKAGLSFTKERIGPREDLGVGGVYVYTMSVQK